MSLLWSRPRLLLIWLLVWALLGVLLGGGLVLLAGQAWLGALRFAVPLALLYALLLPSCWEVSRGQPLARRGLARTLPLWLSSAAMVGLLWLAAAQAWQWLLATDGLQAGEVQGLPHPLMASLWALATGVYMLGLLLADALNALERLQEAQHRAEQSQLRAQEAELLMLRTQVNPHFLFNCLNSISALTSFDAPAAREMTLALAQYYRQTLALSQRPWISVAEELAHCQGFVAIEQVRFGDKLQCCFEIDEQARRGRLAPMLLQPLVENAVKHGVAQRREGGCVTVRGLVREGWLHLIVENPAARDGASAERGTGTGLLNVRQRLASLYGERARLTLRSEPERFVAEMSLPWRAADDDDQSPAG
ncbi:histidine kinase [Paucibacter sp. APW11]|uniref:Histidine kinase n=1 Tax=Roseateles aquae TaxID=3077235 RepID=A0ABU3PDX3_9BURK|nr:histidine kinase [Paucibacter sp. APW11]MDT9000758.1 histidine kinase [Paucibacter sp. APW11]